ncbi:MAG: hypothetical protein WD688_00080 [Candidatus Binatia bacterium]
MATSTTKARHLTGGTRIMWSTLCQKWDYFVLTFLIGLYLTFGAVLAVTFIRIFFPAALP